MEFSPQIQDLLKVARPGEISASLSFYTKLIRQLTDNLTLVDKRVLNLNKYICEMSNEEYEDYLMYLQSVQIGSFFEEFFYSRA